jgi:hypothetical protein
MSRVALLIGALVPAILEGIGVGQAQVVEDTDKRGDDRDEERWDEDGQASHAAFASMGFPGERARITSASSASLVRSSRMRAPLSSFEIVD